MRRIARKADDRSSIYRLQAVSKIEDGRTSFRSPNMVRKSGALQRNLGVMLEKTGVALSS